MNIAEFTRTVDLDEADYREILDLFMPVTPVDLASLRTALASGDVEGVLRAAHSLKGASANLGLTEISGAAGEIEETSRAGRLAETGDALRALDEHIEKIARILAGEMILSFVRGSADGGR